jgi:hypothetical protein
VIIMDAPWWTASLRVVDGGYWCLVFIQRSHQEKGNARLLSHFRDSVTGRYPAFSARIAWFSYWDASIKTLSKYEVVSGGD